MQERLAKKLASEIERERDRILAEEVKRGLGRLGLGEPVPGGTALIRHAHNTEARRIEETRASADAARAEFPDLGQKLLASGPAKLERCFVRFGLPPPSGHSSGRYYSMPSSVRPLGGVSVFEGWRTRSGHVVLDTTRSVTLRTDLLVFQRREGREAYIAIGTPRPERGDDEELLLDPLEKLIPVPRGTVIVATSPSYALEVWNRGKGNDLENALDTEAPKLRGISGPHVLAETRFRSRIKNSRIHGTGHWKRVALIGLELAAETPGADADVCLLSGLLHDAMRENDDHDPGHPERAVEFARRLRRLGVFSLSDARMKKLEEALRDHEKGRTSRDPTVGAAWDADRLCLPRVNIKPDNRLLSTSLGKDPEFKAWAKRLQDTRLSWETVWEAHSEQLLGPEEAPLEEDEASEPELPPRVAFALGLDPSTGRPPGRSRRGGNAREEAFFESLPEVREVRRAVGRMTGTSGTFANLKKNRRR
jgi:uncharacterized protein